MNLSKKIILASSLFFLTAYSTSKGEVDRETNLVKEEITDQKIEGNFQEEEIIDFNDPDFNIENVDYDSCCK
ncbi:Uncharacterised protein [Anaerococcus prevotii]|uniref:Uncharacterized protein n=1 Tax=Anaerococcus prevotii (strain ATCC 9321 / DSM 20548 / JCM 6508 / NCTC 11806 / PC1) TaxID=525919 RepID=C7RGG1_ANAPD|nr:hypothetical protein [Anaerococcus prevotii]ACV28572.1 hypothetical protein Apre_0525 [Anaerococcus prevotii DSM 20548]SUU94130.1 Uncharacterised protein [Anaerococcus prevotii]